MKKKWMPHIIAMVGFVMFIVLALGSATGPRIEHGGASRLHFHANGGIGTLPETQTVNQGESINIPEGAALTRGDAAFVGWFSYSNGVITNFNVGESFTPPGGHIQLFARWKLEADNLESVTGLANKLIWLQNNAQSRGVYTLVSSGNDVVGTQSIFFPGRSNVTVILRGVGGNWRISSATDQTVFVVNPGENRGAVTLILDNGVTIQGQPGIARGVISQLIQVGGNATLRLNQGASITGHSGGGIGVWGRFEMNGGTISNNATTEGGNFGVEIRNGGTFIMNGGNISNNNNSGVYVWNDATFTMNNGTITGNGAGVTMRRGVTRIAGGVTVHFRGTFTMNNGTISDNRDGGVAVRGGGTFIMRDGNITRNSVTGSRGGGVFLSDVGSGSPATFQRIGGNISGNRPDDIHEGDF